MRSPRRDRWRLARAIHCRRVLVRGSHTGRRPRRIRGHPDPDVGTLNIANDHRVGPDDDVITDPHPTRDRSACPDHDACTQMGMTVAGVRAVAISLTQSDPVKERAVLADYCAVTVNYSMRIPQHQPLANPAAGVRFSAGHSETAKQHRTSESMVAGGPRGRLGPQQQDCPNSLIGDDQPRRCPSKHAVHRAGPPPRVPAKGDASVERHSGHALR